MGFLKLDRKIVDSAIWDDGSPYDKAHAWMDLLLYVSYADNERMIRNKIIKIKRGSQFVSDQFLANRWHWSRNRVRRFLAALEAANMLQVKRTPDGTCINVVNYSKFQGRRTANGTADGTTDGTTDGTQLKKDKKDKEYIRTRARGREKLKPPERTYDMDELEKKLLSTN